MKLTQFRIDPEGPGPKSFKTGRTAIAALLLTSLDSAHCTVIHLTLKNYAGYHLVTVFTILDVRVTPDCQPTLVPLILNRTSEKRLHHIRSERPGTGHQLAERSAERDIAHSPTAKDLSYSDTSTWERQFSQG